MIIHILIIWSSLLVLSSGILAKVYLCMHVHGNSIEIIQKWDPRGGKWRRKGEREGEGETSVFMSSYIDTTTIHSHNLNY